MSDYQIQFDGSEWIARLPNRYDEAFASLADAYEHIIDLAGEVMIAILPANPNPRE